jgi:hypothetical protein
MWIATPSLCRTRTDYSLPVSRRTAKNSGHFLTLPLELIQAEKNFNRDRGPPDPEFFVTSDGTKTTRFELADTVSLFRARLEARTWIKPYNREHLDGHLAADNAEP